MGRDAVWNVLPWTINGSAATAEVPQRALWCLGSLALSPRKNVEMGRMAVWNDVVKAMMLHRQSAYVQEIACTALTNLAMNASNLAAISRAKAWVRIAVDAERYISVPGLQCAGCMAIINFSSDDDIPKAMIRFGVLQLVRTALATHNTPPNFRSAAADALYGLA